jgi:hypothetical protein
MSKLEIISPDSSLRKQIESAIKPKITLTKKQKPKIIIFEDDKPVKKTKKMKEKEEKKTRKNKKELIINLPLITGEHNSKTQSF